MMSAEGVHWLIISFKENNQWVSAVMEIDKYCRNMGWEEIDN